jgi:hypothetical protein
MCQKFIRRSGIVLLMGVSPAGLVSYFSNATGEPAEESFFKIVVT